ncbi:hypothetical protein KSX_87210 [Ktedonospora formicarum]|uniref:Uncharacterized protein n=1 Tax=Ktedonospora formicarum TaxID=2778364 RepID=A0A8J3IAZ2_9CHLR|nr:hypothetical protein KSX_87210 [Ktedonospora formicarum]
MASSHMSYAGKTDQLKASSRCWAPIYASKKQAAPAAISTTYAPYITRKLAHLSTLGKV